MKTPNAELINNKIIQEEFVRSHMDNIRDTFKSNADIATAMFTRYNYISKVQEGSNILITPKISIPGYKRFVNVQSKLAFYNMDTNTIDLSINNVDIFYIYLLQFMRHPEYKSLAQGCKLSIRDVEEIRDTIRMYSTPYSINFFTDGINICVPEEDNFGFSFSDNTTVNFKDILFDILSGKQSVRVFPYVAEISATSSEFMAIFKSQSAVFIAKMLDEYEDTELTYDMLAIDFCNKYHRGMIPSINKNLNANKIVSEFLDMYFNENYETDDDDDETTDDDCEESSFF